jgi:hypothetical protein
VAPEIGVTSYTADQAQIQTVPGGDSTAFQQVLLRMPGVVQDSYGEVHIRGEHGNAGYWIDGVMLPEGLEGFGQEFDSHSVPSRSSSETRLFGPGGYPSASGHDAPIPVFSRAGRCLRSR